MMKYFNGLRFTIFFVIIVDFIFQLINLLFFLILENISGRPINNLMILFLVASYILCVFLNKSNMNRFQFFISSVILFSLKDFFDDSKIVNVFYLVCMFIFNLTGIYDVFYLKRDFGEHFLDFIYFKNWFK